jgi:UDP-N-acetylmuramyl pentapeptide synthase
MIYSMEADDREVVRESVNGQVKELGQHVNAAHDEVGPKLQRAD